MAKNHQKPDETAALRALWEAFGRYEARQRAERAVQPAPTDAELLARRIEESRGDTDAITRSFLGFAVPMWIDHFRYWRPVARELAAHLLADTIAFSQEIAALCDPEARGTAGKGGLSKAFDAVAQGLALLAFCPGGVVFGGYHWEAAPGVLPDPLEAAP